ncbi:MAG: YceI family protein [Tatlockia sp.]|nr:YceI family protein [Tatlockia sp.]
MLKIARFALALILFLPVSLTLHAEEIKLTLDPKHSYLIWHVEHMGFSTQAGKWYVSGNLSIDKEKPENSKVQVVIKIADLVTGIPELDKHMLGPLLLDAAKYPTAEFVSNKVQLMGKDSAKVHGTLTLHGVSKPVTLDVTLKKIGKNPMNDKDTVGFSAKTEIKRSEFNIKSLLPQVGDQVKIEIGAEAYKESNEHR